MTFYTKADFPIRYDWTFDEVAEIYTMPLFELIYKAATAHRIYNDAQEVQVCTLLSVKTGGCQEDCAYCPQAARYHTDVKAHRLLPTDEVLRKAQQAKDAGSTRFCMGAAWREVKEGHDFDRVVDMVGQISKMGMEVCCTLGMLNPSQAQRLKEAGLYAYNHNLDSSKDFYNEIITTRTYQDRLETLENIRNANISVCTGGIIGMGETNEDRIALLHTLATLPVHPESVPVNALVAVEGTPLENQKRVSVWDMVRMIATARIVMPKAMVRLSAGRVNMTIEEQALCFMAGANSIFAGDKLLTTANPEVDTDKEMFQLLNIKPRTAYKTEHSTAHVETCVHH